MNAESLVALLQRHRENAARVLDPEALDYFATGSGEEISLSEAERAWREVRLLPHVLRDVSAIDTGVTVLGDALRAPIVVASTAYQLLAHGFGEVETARGAHAAGALMVVATRATTRLEDIAAAAGAPWWFQVYVVRDRGITRELVVRAKSAGGTALVLTGDTPVFGRKPRQGDPPVTEEMHLVNFGDHLATRDGWRDDTAADASITPDTIGWLREMSGLPVLVKGVLRADDAAACVAAGAAGVIVSNHGARQLDRAVSTVRALPAVVDAIGSNSTVLVDGGVRTGVDVLIALALGARAVLIGRPVLWALACDGAAGVSALLNALRDDLVHAMMLAGCRSVSEITRDLIA
ncbi:MAG: alpha-hydroxy-acid oxidizing protein [Candidatus Dormibacteraeota bacterium]|nr:alpha-hydroxy-acid oxidizing protein [Candidatus Dormibacteraeota bacterium]